MAAGKSIKGHSPGPLATAGVGAEAPSRDLELSSVTISYSILDLSEWNKIEQFSWPGLCCAQQTRNQPENEDSLVLHLPDQLAGQPTQE